MTNRRHGRVTTLAVLPGLALLLGACQSKPKVEPATLVLHKGKVVTVYDQKPEAQALAARGDTIPAAAVWACLGRG